jgi:hypothetical protein
MFLQPLWVLLLTLFLLLLSPQPARAFGGFYVGPANAQLQNKAAHVVIARQENKTILTIISDVQTDAQDFALVIPVPGPIAKPQVNIRSSYEEQVLDRVSQPEFQVSNDDSPCTNQQPAENPYFYRSQHAPIASSLSDGNRFFGIDDYEVFILNGHLPELEAWLQLHKYQLPEGAAASLQKYLRPPTKLVVVQFKLPKSEKPGYRFLLPVQIAYRSNQLTLPISLGTLNSAAEQDLTLYLLAAKDKVKIQNYPTVPMATDRAVPEFVQNQPVLPTFYESVFQKAISQNNPETIFLEYRGGLQDQRIEDSQLLAAGAFWKNPYDTHLTRLHLRYGRKKFTQDLTFQTASRPQPFQVRYQITRPYRQPIACNKATKYQQKVMARQRQEAQSLAQLTDWPIDSIQAQIQPFEILTRQPPKPFWPW